MPTFFFATCRTGSEASLKREVAHRYGKQLTPAFMRPQLITWKAQEGLPEHFEFEATFATVSGRSIGTAKTVEDAVALIEGAQLANAVVHVFPRVVPEDGVEEAQWKKADEIQRGIDALLPTPRPELTLGREVVDVIVGEEGEPWLIGRHRHQRATHPHAGAIPRLSIPQEAPSRAWLKMEQALAWVGLDEKGVLTDLAAVELGSAPGGASYALLKRGMDVYGVDTGAMDPCVLAQRKYHHIALSAGDLGPDILPPNVDLIASDMNLQPEVVLRYVEPMVRHHEPRWLILTFKINDAEVESRLPHYLERIRRFAPSPVRAKQLHANRKEITVVAGE